ncbi:MAG TPA: hypothetical protein VFJ85_15175 [Acidimicrobiales bacterium]|nr:hypothetical protein [Acidimicrobiales bacterium]
MEPTETPRSDGGAAKRRINSGIVAAGVAFGLTLAGLGVAAAQTDTTGDTSTTTAQAATTAAPSSSDTTAPAASAPSQTGSAAAPQQAPPRAAETPLTGDTAEKVKAAALGAVPGGTVIRAETDSDGSPYEAHVRTSDGTEVVVKVGADFKVTGIETGPAGGHHGGRGPGGPGGQAELTGDAAAKATAAAQAAVPGGSVLRAEQNPDGSGYHVHVQKSDGTEVVVRLDTNFKVTGVDTAPPGFGGPGGHPGPGGPAPDGSTTPTTTS